MEEGTDLRGMSQRARKPGSRIEAPARLARATKRLQHLRRWQRWQRLTRTGWGRAVVAAADDERPVSGKIDSRDWVRVRRERLRRRATQRGGELRPSRCPLFQLTLR